MQWWRCSQAGNSWRDMPRRSSVRMPMPRACRRRVFGSTCVGSARTRARRAGVSGCLSRGVVSPSRLSRRAGAVREQWPWRSLMQGRALWLRLTISGLDCWRLEPSRPLVRMASRVPWRIPTTPSVPAGRPSRVPHDTTPVDCLIVRAPTRGSDRRSRAREMARWVMESGWFAGSAGAGENVGCMRARTERGRVDRAAREKQCQVRHVQHLNLVASQLTSTCG